MALGLAIGQWRYGWETGCVLLVVSLNLLFLSVRDFLNLRLCCQFHGGVKKIEFGSKSAG